MIQSGEALLDGYRVGASPDPEDVPCETNTGTRRRIRIHQRSLPAVASGGLIRLGKLFAPIETPP